MEAMLPTKPENYSSLIARSLRLYRASFAKIGYLSLLLSTIVFAPQLVEDIVGFPIFAALPLFSPLRLLFVLVEILAFGLFIAILWHAHCVVKHHQDPVSEDVKIGAKKAVFGFLGALFVSILFFVLGLGITYFLFALTKLQLLFINTTGGVLFTSTMFLLVIAAFFYTGALFIFFLPLIVIENKSVFASLKTSALLVWNHWFSVLITQATPWLWYVVALCVIRILAGINVHLFFTFNTTSNLLVTIANIIIFALFIPWFATLLLVQLKDLEQRNHLTPEDDK